MKFVRQGGAADQCRHRTSGHAPPDRDGRTCRPKGRPARHGGGRLDIRGKYLEHLLSYVKGAPLRKLKVVVKSGATAGRDSSSMRSRPHLAVRVREGEPQARWHLPERGAETQIAGGKPRSHRRLWCVASGADVGPGLGRGLTTAASSSMRAGLFNRGGTTWSGSWRSLSSSRSRARASSMTRASPGNTLDIVRPPWRPPRCCCKVRDMRSSKQKMREVDAAYGGEMSAHHYFRKFRLLRQRHGFPGSWCSQ